MLNELEPGPRRSASHMMQISRLFLASINHLLHDLTISGILNLLFRRFEQISGIVFGIFPQCEATSPREPSAVSFQS